jgi:hypothetical protein
LDSREFAEGRERALFKGPLWRKDGWRSTQEFIDHFPRYAQQLSAGLDLIQIFLAPLHVEQRVRRRVEASIVRAIYGLPETLRGLFPAGYRMWARREDEEVVTAVNAGNLPLQIPQSLDC